MIKLILTILCFFLAFKVSAFTVKVQTPALQKIIYTNGIIVSQIQPKISCSFKNKTDNTVKLFSRTIQSSLESLDPDNTRIQRYRLVSRKGLFIKKLAGYQVEACSYHLSIIGKSKSDHKPISGEIIVLGQLDGTMSQEEISILKNKIYLSNYINKKLKKMLLIPSKISGKKQIINLYH